MILAKYYFINSNVTPFSSMNFSYQFPRGTRFIEFHASSPFNILNSTWQIILNNIKINVGLNYNITFLEKGLPANTKWYVNLSNGQSFSSTTNTITFSEPNGTYSYTIATVNKNYAPTPSSGTFTVNGTNMNIAITFNLVTYTVTFTESGLPSGTTWYVNLSNGQSFSGTGTTITFSESNGTYLYMISVTDKNYNPLPSSGKFIVNGYNINISIIFMASTYKVTFIEEGLPAGSEWGIYLNNGMYQRSTNSTITFNLKNGTYYYQVVYPSGYVMNGLSNKIVINGSSLTIKLTFVTKNSGGSYFNYIIYLVIISAISATIFLSIFLIRRRKR